MKDSAGLGWAGLRAGPRLVLVCASGQCPYSSVCQCGSVPWFALCFGSSSSAQIDKTCHRAGGPFFFSLSWDDHIQAHPKITGQPCPPAWRRAQLAGKTMRPWARYPWPSMALQWHPVGKSAGSQYLANCPWQERWSWKRLGIECDRTVSYLSAPLPRNTRAHGCSCCGQESQILYRTLHCSPWGYLGTWAPLCSL